MATHTLTGMDLIRSIPRARQRIVDALGCNRSAPYQWTQVPAERVVAVSRALGIPREQLRPDLFEQDAA